MGGNHGAESGPRVLRRGSVIYGADREVAQWVAKRIPGFMGMPGAVSLGVVKNDKLVAGVVFERCNGAHIEASIAARPGARWADRSTLFSLFAYPFLQLDLLAVSVLVSQENLVSLNLATKLGFQPIAIVPYAAQGGAPLIVLQMTRNQCRWLDYGQRGKRAAGT